jgi:hypothetical protein
MVDQPAEAICYVAPAPAPVPSPAPPQLSSPPPTVADPRAVRRLTDSGGALKKRKHGVGAIAALEYLQAECSLEKCSEGELLPNNSRGPNRPASAALMFLMQIKEQIHQPQWGTWSPMQLARGVERLYTTLNDEKREDLEKVRTVALSQFIWTRQLGEPELCLALNLTDRNCESSMSNSEPSANPSEAELGRGCPMPADPLARTLAPRGHLRRLAPRGCTGVPRS